MKKFHFRLGRLLVLKSSLERHQSIECRKLEDAVRRSMTDKVNLEDERELLRSKSGVSDDGVMDLSKIKAILSYIDVLDHSIDLKRKEIAERQGRLLAARSVLIEQMKERRMLENMKERLLSVYRKDFEKELQRKLDDFSQKGENGDDDDFYGLGEGPSHPS